MIAKMDRPNRERSKKKKTLSRFKREGNRLSLLGEIAEAGKGHSS